MLRQFSLLLTLFTLLAAPVRAQEVLTDDSDRDPFESWNRAVFTFNDGLDTWFMRPVAKGYHFIMPDFAERGVTNFFANLYDANSVVNATLQGRFNHAARGSGRFLVNTVFGVAGVFDVATRMGLTPYPTDFGHTLAIWGAPSGPYLMVPLFGPRTVRSGAGSIVDVYGLPQTYVDNVALRNSLYGLELIEARARLLDVDKLTSGDRYIFIRDAYLQQREVLVNDGKIQDDFSDYGADGDWEEDF
ncbi:MlaA family lipoprotein [Parahaliea aestuarii]|uniref:VacJ family lipoprotein n=1 Tax=Parahaliea aestuarii TaxID=1852021 RepID=A0A5C9A0J3_9GAMM|nr:VacJ family lipoprotein [Parahaliea aestuarii]TXS93402.1 VacJ family lipoprotein [Parahaliea aestuarii]